MTQNPDVGDTIREGPYSGFELVSKYTSGQAVEDGVLFDVDLLAKTRNPTPLKYVTTGLLAKGYWNDTCEKGITRGEAGKSDRCPSCEVFIKHHGDKLACSEPTLNIPNMVDLITQGLRIFSKKPADDWFVSGMIELPSGQKQKVFIAQNETGRYTLMLPEDY